MLQLIQPIASLFIGIAMTVYGLVHAVTRYPGRETFATLAADLPAVTSVLVFALGLVAIAAGIVLTVIGSRTLRRRWRRFSHIARHAVERPMYDDDEQWQHVYR